MLKAPDNIFIQIERLVLKRPERLDQREWHTLPNGNEAFTMEEILAPDTRHCLLGWIVALTPGAALHEQRRGDVEEFAQDLLVRAGKLPIPWGIIFADEASALKLIRGRAAEERLGL